MPRLQLHLLGDFRVELDGSPFSDFGTDKTRALLAYLCVEASRAHRREHLAGLLWPEQPDEAARRSLRQALFKLRQVLQGHSEYGVPSGAALGSDPEFAQRRGKSVVKEGSPELLRVRALDVQLDPEADYWSDVEAFTNLLTASRLHRHRKAEQCTTCHARLQQAADLYRGDFLADFFLEDTQEFDEWLVLRREGLRRLALETFHRLAIYCATRAEYEPALQYAYRQLESEPWREEAHRQVIWLLALTGQRSAALAQYETCRQVLAAELNTEPSDETTALYERLRTGNWEPRDGNRESETDTDSRLLTSDSQPRHNVPRQLTPFIGRREELGRIIERLDSPDYSLITLMGQGGVGKTRLALEVATRQVGAFDDGVYWVPLASITSPQLLASSIGQAIGFHFEASEDPQTQLLNYLSGKEMLLLLDNFEHLLAGGEASDLLLSILRSAPRISILVTSRERLGLQAEFLLDISGLAFPEVDDALASYDAVRLFVERAQQVNPAFALSPNTAQGVIDICRLVAGLPLGIVLAAAWIRHFSPARIASSIKTNLDFLTSATRDAVPQHTSLRAVFNHSWGLLSEEERRAFRNLSVFRGGWEEEAAERVAAASLPGLRREPWHSLLSLVDKSLVRRGALGRYEIHEVLRQYATEKLDELPEDRDQVRLRHAEYYLHLADEPGLRSEDQGKWFERLEREHDNLRAVLQWARDNKEVEIGLRLGGALSRFWFVRGYYSEGREALAAALESSNLPTFQRSNAFRAKALRGAGDLDRAMGDYASARSLYEESLVIYRELGDKKDIAVALVRVAMIPWEQGDHVLARSLYEESLAISRELGDKNDISITLANLGLMAFETGDYPTARSLLEESLALDRGDKFSLAIRINNLGNVALMQGDYAGARALHMEGMALRRELGDKWGIAISLIGLGGAAVLTGDAERGARVLGAADALLTAIGARLEADDRIPYEHGVAYARARLDEEAFARAWAEGRALSMEEAIEYTLGGNGSD